MNANGLCHVLIAAESGRFAPLPVRAVSSDDSTPDATKQIEELYGDLKAKVSIWSVFFVRRILAIPTSSSQGVLVHGTCRDF